MKGGAPLGSAQSGQGEKAMPNSIAHFVRLVFKIEYVG